MQPGVIMSSQPSFDFARSEPKKWSEAKPMRRSAIQSFQTFDGASPSDRPSTEERRRYARLPLTLSGRYMLADGSEFPCQTQDISPIGIGIQGFPAGAIGDRVVAYFDGLGRVEAGSSGDPKPGLPSR
jgi:hypothetical protein